MTKIIFFNCLPDSNAFCITEYFTYSECFITFEDDNLVNFARFLVVEVDRQQIYDAVIQLFKGINKHEFIKLLHENNLQYSTFVCRD